MHDRMARSRLEMLAEEETEAEAERARFEELADQYRQQSHLPPGGDQSWREREAMRRAAYGMGYAPPQSDASEREREAMRFTPAGADDVAAMGEAPHGLQEPVLQPIHAAKGGQGGIVLIFILVAAIGLGIAVLAYPQMLTASYWRAPQTNSETQNPAPPAAKPYTAPAAQPAPPPVEQMPALDLKRTPVEPAPSSAPPPPVSVIDATPKPTPKPASRSRAAVREDRGTGGFYAKVPGPNGGMEYQYFSANPDSRAPAPKKPAVPDTGGFYAKVPGPDGTLQDQYFPRQPPPR